MKKLYLFSFLFFFGLNISSITGTNKKNIEPRIIEADVCVYSATPSGIMAAIAVKEEGKSVVIIEPGRWVGGILGAGIKPFQDCPNFEAVGGRTREVMKILGIEDDSREYSEAEVRQKMKSTMSPREIRNDFLDLLQKHDIRVVYNQRINRCEKRDAQIEKAVFDYAPFDETGCPVASADSVENLAVRAKIFIDASYDGQLLWRAGVSFRTGRESELDYGEEYAGVQEPMNVTPIDPFIHKGKPESGLLNLIQQDHGKPVGAGDYFTQAYNFRYYITSSPEYRASIEPPENYDAMDYELVGRYVEYLKKEFSDEEELHQRLSWIFPGWLNSQEYNYQRNSLITMAPVGVSQLLANGDYAVKAAVWKYHQDYLRGLHHFLSTDERVPEKFRQQTAQTGLDKRHHPDTQGWPNQLYIRVARRMAGRYTITANDVYNRTQIDEPIGLAQYGIDTYPSRRIWFEKEGNYYVALEGRMFVGGPKGPTNTPYPISYRAITPQSNECTNLLVPVCFSASHLGYASARMEPVFMICGESAGIAAVHAIDLNSNVQDIDMKRYQRHLKKLSQRLSWPVKKKIKQ